MGKKTTSGGPPRRSVRKVCRNIGRRPKPRGSGFLLGTIEFSANNLGKAAQHLTIGVLGLGHPKDAQKYLAQVLQISSVTERKLYSEWLAQTASLSAQANGVVALLRVLRLCGLQMKPGS